MKTIGVLISSVLVSAGVMGSLTGCKKAEMQSAMTVRMTDAPAAYSEVNVDIQSVEVHHSGIGWSTMPTNQGIYNLLDLQNNVTVVLVDSTIVPAGHVTQLRLVLGPNNTIVDSTDAVYDLIVPSGQETGLKMNLDVDLLANMTTEVVFDFDAEKSVVFLGNGIYHLKPVIKIDSVVQH